MLIYNYLNQYVFAEKIYSNFIINIFKKNKISIAKIIIFFNVTTG